MKRIALDKLIGSVVLALVVLALLAVMFAPRRDTRPPAVHPYGWAVDVARQDYDCQTVRVGEPRNDQRPGECVLEPRPDTDGAVTLYTAAAMYLLQPGL
jgi:hypothetical protein